MDHHISHMHRFLIPDGSSRGSSLTIIAADDIIVHSHKLQTTMHPASFQLQLFNLRVGNQITVIANSQHLLTAIEFQVHVPHRALQPSVIFLSPAR